MGARVARQRVDDRIELLLEVLDQAFDRKGWHGTTLRGSLRGITPEQALWRPARGRHNIWELTVHAAYWKYIAVRRLTGAKRGSFDLKGSNWFERSGKPLRVDWQRDLLFGRQCSHGALECSFVKLKPIRNASTINRFQCRLDCGQVPTPFANFDHISWLHQCPSHRDLLAVYREVTMTHHLTSLLARRTEP